MASVSKNNTWESGSLVLVCMPRLSERSYHGATSHSLTKKPPIMNYTLTDHGLGVEEQHMRVGVPGVGAHAIRANALTTELHLAPSQRNNKLYTNQSWPRCRRTTRESRGPWCWFARPEWANALTTELHLAPSHRNKETTNNELYTNRSWPRCRRTTRESRGPWCWFARPEWANALTTELHLAPSHRNKETTNNELYTNRSWPRCRRTTRESRGPWCWFATPWANTLTTELHLAPSQRNNELYTNRSWPRCWRTTRESRGPWCWFAHHERTL